ncbi:hypothetical protein XM38_027830 [Halomicronema hongdechloris C2206]|uniref:DUF697 domain-containing protein n=1 Tax=Halomicronema hongdechloris C2206 TaxID=1641165 RepID=A0A1Z3HNG1_9CYAN|nr:hypothetical protein [Halomicronema hongdechloris]ASC71829.1 hypothetical protein XM38_027830 [Halomicronema hongdechloris C2206]
MASAPSYGTEPNQAQSMMQAISDTLYTGATQAGDAFIRLTYPLIEQGTEVLGRTVAPIADFPLIKTATGIPGINWLLAALGQVNAEEVRGAIAQLRRQHPLDTDEQLAQRVMLDTAGRAAQVGLLTNLVPPLALMLFALDIGAIAALQADMIYRIATIYGFSPAAASRRGEVLAIWSVSTGSSGLAKSGLSFVELLPLIGPAVGITSDAAIVYGVGFLACRYYDVKRTR